MKKIIKNIKFWVNFLTNSEFRYYIKSDAYYYKHVCYDCGNQDWQGYEIIGGLCNSCRRTQMEHEFESN